MAPDSPGAGWTATSAGANLLRKASTTAAFLATPPWSTTLEPGRRPRATRSR